MSMAKKQIKEVKKKRLGRPPSVSPGAYTMISLRVQKEIPKILSEVVENNLDYNPKITRADVVRTMIWYASTLSPQQLFKIFQEFNRNVKI